MSDMLPLPTRAAVACGRRWPVLAPAAITVLLIAGCGSDDNSPSSAAGVAGSSIDRAFVAEMVALHRTTVEMATIASSEATSRFVKALALDIARTQKREIARMQRVDAKLENAGILAGELGAKDPMHGMKMTAADLRGAKPFDDTFIGVMVPEDQRAIEMARAELAKGASAELKPLAQTIVHTQEREITAMNAHLNR